MVILTIDLVVLPQISPFNTSDSYKVAELTLDLIYGLKGSSN